ncbi:MAG: GspE/PulE family protein [Oscillospiraceae bacterium]|nr:GspE/PulE family protein [Oscillospiraceae bacterium]
MVAVNNGKQDKVDLKCCRIDIEAVKSISPEIAKKYKVMPISFIDGKLNLAMSEPLNFFAIDDITFMIQKPVTPIMADSAAIEECISIYYSGEAETKGKHFEATASHSAITAASASGTSAAEEDESVKKAPAVLLVNKILNTSITMGASDIHIEPFEESVRVRFRVDGVLKENMYMPPELFAPVSTRLKILAGMDIAEKRLPQDGRIEFEVSRSKYDFRVSSLPTVFGEKLEIRKLERTGFSFSRDSLQFSEKENELLDIAMRAPHGIILATGPTGSGKTTTIYNILNELNDCEKNIVTIEDPVEYVMEGINQVQVNTKAGLTFASGLRSVLRQDPDIIMVGEIRDEETAAIAVRAAITGHMVLSTLHTNDAPGAVTRLMDMGMEPYLLREAITCVIAQRLVRRLCIHCKIKRDLTAREAEILNVRGGQESVNVAGVFSPVGCEKCNNIGYSGRRAIREVLLFNDKIRKEIDDGKNADALRCVAIQAGMTTLFDNCVQVVLDGETSVQELVRVVYGRV